MRGVSDVSCGDLSGLDLEVVLKRVLETARELTGGQIRGVGVS
jgi:hypothetical protein